MTNPTATALEVAKLSEHTSKPSCCLLAVNPCGKASVYSTSKEFPLMTPRRCNPRFHDPGQVFQNLDALFETPKDFPYHSRLTGKKSAGIPYKILPKEKILSENVSKSLSQPMASPLPSHRWPNLPSRQRTLPINRYPWS